MVVTIFQSNLSFEKKLLMGIPIFLKASKFTIEKQRLLHYHKHWSYNHHSHTLQVTKGKAFMADIPVSRR